MKEIKLSQKGKNKGKYVALVDDCDYEYLNQWEWRALITGKNIYAIRSPNILMHRIIINTPKGMDTDHRDHNGLNNQRSNLRICTTSQNLFNRSNAIRSKVKYKGVSKSKRGYKVYIFHDGKQINLGRFTNIIEAAKVYDEAAKKYHGEFACLNFKDGY